MCFSLVAAAETMRQCCRVNFYFAPEGGCVSRTGENSVLDGSIGRRNGSLPILKGIQSNKIKLKGIGNHEEEQIQIPKRLVCKD